MLAVVLALLVPLEDRRPVPFGAVCVHSVEVNTYGPEGDKRTAILFRDSAGMVIDWRWDKGIIISDHRAEWTERGRDRLVIFKMLKRTRTIHDVELLERQQKPRHKRPPLFLR